MDSLTFLARKAKLKLQPIYVVHGDEDFLKRQVMQALRVLVLGEDTDEFALSQYAGDRVDYATVMDDLQTVPFFGPRRLVIVDNADPFITRYRPALEKAVPRLPSSGVLVLEVKSWPTTTRLAKLIHDEATIGCKAPTTARLTGWCVEWAQSQYGKQLTQQAATLLVALIGQDMGQLDQELSKLAAYIGQRARISDEDVDKLVNRSQEQKTWVIFDAIAEGNTKAALDILDRLLEQGDEPFKIMGAFSMQLRRLGQAARLAQQGQPLAAALEEAGVAPFFVAGAIKQLKHLGQQRANQLYNMLLEINMDLRGESPLPERTLLERLVIRLARPKA